MPDENATRADQSAVGLAGVGGGCLAGFGGALLGGILGFLICLVLPNGPPMRTGGEEAIVDHINAFGRHVMQALTFVGGGTFLGGILGTVIGVRFGVRRAAGPQPPPPAFAVLPASAQSRPIDYATPAPSRRAPLVLAVVLGVVVLGLFLIVWMLATPATVSPPAPPTVQAEVRNAPPMAPVPTPAPVRQPASTSSP